MCMCSENPKCTHLQYLRTDAIRSLKRKQKPFARTPRSSFTETVITRTSEALVTTHLCWATLHVLCNFHPRNLRQPLRALLHGMMERATPCSTHDRRFPKDNESDSSTVPTPTNPSREPGSDPRTWDGLSIAM